MTEDLFVIILLNVQSISGQGICFTALVLGSLMVDDCMVKSVSLQDNFVKKKMAIRATKGNLNLFCTKSIILLLCLNPD